MCQVKISPHDEGAQKTSSLRDHNNLACSKPECRSKEDSRSEDPPEYLSTPPSGHGKSKSYLQTGKSMRLPLACSARTHVLLASHLILCCTELIPLVLMASPLSESVSHASGNDVDYSGIPLETVSPSSARHGSGSHQRARSTCCDGHHDVSGDSDGHFEPTSDHVSEEHIHRDIEHGAVLERVTLVVFGMDCSDCAERLRKNLIRLPGVYHPSVSFVHGKADIQLDASMNSSDGVAQAIHEMNTRYRCIPVADEQHHLDVSITRSSIKSVEEQGVPGILDILSLGDNVGRITYDPAVVGARALFGLLSQKYPDVELAPLEDDPALSIGRTARKEQLIKLCLATALALPVAVLNMGDVPMDERRKAVVSLVLATLVQLIAVPDFYRPALISAIKYRTLEMDMLVTVSITAAYVFSVAAFGYLMAGNPLEEKPFFETSALLIAFVLLGRFTAACARTYAVERVSLRSLQPTRAVVIEDGRDSEIDSRLLQLGDRFKVLPETKVPTDGIVVEGTGEVDESMLTGESLPVIKSPGSTVSAGTLNGSATFVVELRRLPGANTVTDIAKQVEEASNSRPRVQELADRVAKYLVTIVVTVATLVFLTWFLVETRARQVDVGTASARAITFAVAVLAVSCPCALGLAVPMVIVVAGGVAAKDGVVIKTSEATVGARRVTDVVFDKTGTITQSALEVGTAVTFAHRREAVFSIVKALVANNRHPVSVAVHQCLENHNVDAAEVTDTHAHPGQGVLARLGDSILKAGSPSWTLCESEPVVKGFVSDGFSILSVTQDDKLIACFPLRARLQHDAAEVVHDLGRQGIAVHLVSGDQDVACWNAAREAGIPDGNVASKRSLADKVAYVTRLQEQGKVVMFCGDGANDAGAVSRADVGVHVGGSLSSSDITCDAADVVLLSGLKGVPYMLHLSRCAFRRILFNFAWAIAYNTLAILLASGLFAVTGNDEVRIPPQFAGLGELVSVLPVILAGGTMFFSRSARRRNPLSRSL